MGNEVEVSGNCLGCRGWNRTITSVFKGRWPAFSRPGSGINGGTSWTCTTRPQRRVRVSTAARLLGRLTLQNGAAGRIRTFNLPVLSGTPLPIGLLRRTETRRTNHQRPTEGRSSNALPNRLAIRIRESDFLRSLACGLRHSKGGASPGRRTPTARLKRPPLFFPSSRCLKW